MGSTIASSTINPIYRGKTSMEIKSAKESKLNIPRYPVRSKAAIILKKGVSTTKNQIPSVEAFVRYSKRNYIAFKPIIDSDYTLGKLLFRPSYLYVLLLLSVGTVMMPPGSSFSVLRLCFSMTLLVVYYGGLLVLRPLKHDRRWILPIHIS